METTRDTFLGGRLHLHQPARGYRAGIDPVLLAAACDVTSGAQVLDLGCGVGTALLCLAQRIPGLTLFGVERDPDLAALARENAAENGHAATIVTADLTALPPDLRQRQFDLVLTNPPFFDRRVTSRSPEATREAGRGEETPLSAWIAVAEKRLAPKGHLVCIQRAERLPDLLAACGDTLGAREVIPIQPRTDRPARLVILRARKTKAATFCLRSPVVLHAGARHVADGDDYRPEISVVLRDGAVLPVK